MYRSFTAFFSICGLPGLPFEHGEVWQWHRSSLAMDCRGLVRGRPLRRDADGLFDAFRRHASLLDPAILYAAVNLGTLRCFHTDRVAPRPGFPGCAPEPHQLARPLSRLRRDLCAWMRLEIGLRDRTQSLGAHSRTGLFLAYVAEQIRRRLSGLSDPLFFYSSDQLRTRFQRNAGSARNGNSSAQRAVVTGTIAHSAPTD